MPSVKEMGVGIENQNTNTILEWRQSSGVKVHIWIWFLPLHPPQPHPTTPPTRWPQLPWLRFPTIKLKNRQTPLPNNGQRCWKAIPRPLCFISVGGREDEKSRYPPGLEEEVSESTWGKKTVYDHWDTSVEKSKTQVLNSCPYETKQCHNV